MTDEPKQEALEPRQTDTLARIGTWLLTGTCVYMGFLWWRWLVGRMGPQNAGNIGMQLVLAAVVFVPIALFLWFMLALIRPRK